MVDEVPQGDTEDANYEPIIKRHRLSVALCWKSLECIKLAAKPEELPGLQLAENAIIAVGMINFRTDQHVLDRIVNHRQYRYKIRHARSKEFRNQARRELIGLLRRLRSGNRIQG